MRKITFPHMGNLDIGVKTFFNEMGMEVVSPPHNSKKTLDIGVKDSPEFACLPLKYNLGNFVEALEEGANTIIMGGGVGPCRFGYYGEVQREILEEMGYEFDMICLEPDLIESFFKLRNLFGGIPLRRLYKAGKLTWIKMTAIDNTHKLVLKARAREKKEGQVEKIYNEYLKKITEIMSIDKIRKLTTEYQTYIKSAMGEYKRGVEIKIGVVGEIYLVLEPFSNLEINKKLGQLGAVVEREIYLTQWMYDFLHLGNEQELIEEAARPYLDSFVGGHGQDTIGNMVRYARDGFDGVIQVLPFTCMPEIVAQTVIPVVSKEENIPALTLIFDEHTGEAGLQTRLEAFIDLIIRKKQKKGVEKREKKLHGN